MSTSLNQGATGKSRDIKQKSEQYCRTIPTRMGHCAEEDGLTGSYDVTVEPSGLLGKHFFQVPWVLDHLTL